MLVQASVSVEDYLKAVWKASSRGEEVTPSVLARALSVRAPSVSGMVRRLRASGLVVDAAPGSPVRLTARGERTARTVVRRHRLLETFLVQVLGLSWDEVHEEAERLEHALSPRVERAVAELLGDPVVDPHGDPIPPPSGRWREDWGTPLTDAPVGGGFTVRRVEDAEPDALRHLSRAGVLPGATLRVVDREPFGGPLWVRVTRADGSAAPRRALGPALAARVHGTCDAPPARP